MLDSRVLTYHEKNGVGFLTYDALEKLPFIHHAFSTKIGNDSETCHVMDLSFEHDEKEKVTKNYHLFCDAAGFVFEDLVASSQDHHTFVRVCTENEKGVGVYREKDIESVDALVTNVPGLTLVTYYADCTPLFFVDPKQKAIGLAHAGWRGTVARIGEKVVNTMQKEYATEPKDLIIAIGPNISKCCYEIDEPVAEKFRRLGLDDSKFLFEKGNGKYMADMLEANRQILLSCGVNDENITISDVCTRCHSDVLWSHRATKGDRGTMAAFMRLESD